MRKYKINYMKSEPTDSSVTKYMNFNGILVKYRSITFWTKMSYGMAAGIAMIVTLSAAAYLVYPSLFQFGNKTEVSNDIKEQKEEDKSLIVPLSEREIAAGKNEEKEVEDIDSESEDFEKNGVEQEKSTDLSSKEEDVVVNAEKEAADIMNDEISEDIEYIFLEATPKIGFDSLYNYLNSEMLPLKTLTEETKGTVIVMFEIGVNGKAQNLRVTQGLSTEADQEALRLITIMPEWIPAKLNGEAVESTMSLPVHFELTKN